MIQALLLAQILFYTLPSGYPPVQGRGVMILGFGIEPMVIRPEAMESYLPTVVHRPDWTMASVPWVEPELEHQDVVKDWLVATKQQDSYAPVWIGAAAVNRDSDPGAVRGPVVVSTDAGAIQSHCYVPGEAHNELTLPCVTIEP